LPRKVDAVIESVGAATWGHSVRSVRPGGTIAICGATTGDQPGAELTRLFFQDIRVQGCTMGSREDFARLLRFVEHADLHPVIDSVVSGLDAAPEAFAKMIAGDVFGKIVIEL
jgi:NADPH:quinone reductase-like Zn-dependent oxidoreductase